jgi:hypothetical protein
MTSTVTVPPRVISGSIGGRIRLILGDSGSEWLLLLNEDDGNREYQTPLWSSIPNDVAKQINNCTSKGRYIREIDFGGPDSKPLWYMNGIKRDQTGDHSWWSANASELDIENFTGESQFRVAFGTGQADDGANYNYSGQEEAKYVYLYRRNGYFARCCNSHLENRMSRIQNRGKKIHSVRLFHNDGFFISDDEGKEWYGVGEHCGKELQKRNKKVEEVAVAKDGSWIVIFSNDFSASTGIDERLREQLARFFGRQRARNQTREQEITDYHARIAQEKAEQEAREAAERARVEQEEREAAAAAEREQLEREEQERIEQEAAEQERLRQQEEETSYRQQAEREAVARQEMEACLEKQLLEEAQSISDLESLLNNRKRSLQQMIVTLPPERRPRLREILSDAAVSNSNSETTTTTIEENTNNTPHAAVTRSTVAGCVVCHDANAERAMVPCGHFCLCDDCSETLWTQDGAKLCPLCRVPIQRSLKIFRSH